MSQDCREQQILLCDLHRIGIGKADVRASGLSNVEVGRDMALYCRMKLLSSLSPLLSLSRSLMGARDRRSLTNLTSSVTGGTPEPPPGSPFCPKDFRDCDQPHEIMDYIYKSWRNLRTSPSPQGPMASGWYSPSCSPEYGVKL